MLTLFSLVPEEQSGEGVHSNHDIELNNIYIILKLFGIILKSYGLIESLWTHKFEKNSVNPLQSVP